MESISYSCQSLVYDASSDVVPATLKQLIMKLSVRLVDGRLAHAQLFQIDFQDSQHTLPGSVSLPRDMTVKSHISHVCRSMAGFECLNRLTV